MGVLAAAGALALGAVACGGGGSDIDKSVDELNFSLASAQDAGLYGAEEVPSSEPSGTTPAGPTAEGYSGYSQATDDNSTISFAAPNEWSDRVSGDVGPFQTSMTASPDIDGLLGGWSIPGVFVGASKSLGAQIAEAEFPELALPTVFASVSPRAATSEDCDDGVDTYLVGRAGSATVINQALSDLVDVGLADLYSNCGGNGTAFLDFAGYSKTGQTFLYFQFTATSDADIDALVEFLGSLQVDYAKVPAPSSDQTAPDLIVP